MKRPPPSFTLKDTLMDTIILPRRLFCPFPIGISPHVQLAEQHTIDWILSFGLLPNEQQIEVYRSQGHAYMVGRMFPAATPETFCAYSDLNTLLFLVDDYLDQQDAMVSGGNSTGAVKEFICNIYAILDAPESWIAGKEPVLDALAELWLRLSNLGTPTWISKYKGSLQAIFEAAMWQHRNIEAGIWPSIEDYMERRQYIGAGNVATDCIEMIYRIELPESVWQLEWLVELRDLCRNILCWANDLFSHDKERHTGEYHNLISLICHHKGSSLAEAIDEVIRFHDAQVERFIHVRDNRPFVDAQYEPGVRLYIDVLQSIMRGNIDWSDNETTRYTYKYASEEKALLLK